MPRSSFDFDRGVTQWRMEPLTGSTRRGLWAFTLGYDGVVPRYEDIAYGDYFQTSQDIDTTNVGLIRCHVNITQPKTLPSFENVSTDLQFIAESVGSPGNRIVIARGLTEADINKTLITTGYTNSGNNDTFKLVGIADSLTAYVDKTVVTEGPNSAGTATIIGARWKFSLLIDGIEYARCIQSERESGFYRDDLMLHCSKLTGVHTISFRITLIAQEQDNSYPFSDLPDMTTTRYWFDPGFGVTRITANAVTGWLDRTGNGWDLHTPAGGNTAPTWMSGQLNGKPGLYFGNPVGGASDWSLAHYGGPFYTGAPGSFPAAFPFGESEPRIFYIVALPQAGAPPGGGTGGGMLMADRKDFSLELWTLSGTQQRLARNAGIALLQVNPSVDYTNVPLLLIYRWTGTNLFITINGVTLSTVDNFTTLPSTVFPPVLDSDARHTIMVGGTFVDQSGFQGLIFDVIAAADATINPITVNYLKNKYGIP